MNIEKQINAFAGRLLQDTDDFAVENVRKGLGGPFGASVHVYNTRTAELIQIGDLRANAVLSTGMGSAHAEDQAMSPAMIAELRAVLAEAEKPAHNRVIFSSSGQSCPACHAKEEILARTLIQEGLLKSGNFLVHYGATYEDTAEIAGFNDAPYHEDMQKTPTRRMIQTLQSSDGFDVQESISTIFEDAIEPVSVIEMPDGVLYIGYENRADDLMATSEVSAIRAAARAQKEAGADTPWNLGAATLYTSGTPGPLGYAECQWANVTRWVMVDHARKDDWATQEAPNISNTAFFNIIAAAHYNGPESAITVQRLSPFENKSQYAWKEKLAAEEEPSKILYNGADIS